VSDLPTRFTNEGIPYKLLAIPFETKESALAFLKKKTKEIPQHKPMMQGGIVYGNKWGVYAMVNPTLPIHKGPVPTGYSFVGIFETRQKVDRWYDAAIKAKDPKPYLLTYSGGLYHLWTFKRKGEGKLVGTGWDESKVKPLERKK
jgi:hypothetical protein